MFCYELAFRINGFNYLIGFSAEKMKFRAMLHCMRQFVFGATLD